VGLENFLNILEIELIILGGGIAENSKLFSNVIKNKFRKIMPDLNIVTADDEKIMTIKGCAASFILDILN